MSTTSETRYPCPFCLQGYKSEAAMKAHSDKCTKNPVLYERAKADEDEKIKQAKEDQAKAEAEKLALEKKKREEAEALRQERLKVGIGKVETAGRFVLVLINSPWEVPKALSYMEEQGFVILQYPALGTSPVLFALFTKVDAKK